MRLSFVSKACRRAKTGKSKSPVVLSAIVSDAPFETKTVPDRYDLEAIRLPGKHPEQLGGIMTGMGSVTAILAVNASSTSPVAAIRLAVPMSSRCIGNAGRHATCTASIRGTAPPVLG